MFSIKRLSHYKLILISMLCITLATGAAEIETIRLSHRTAESIASVIKPLLESDETIIPNGSILIIKASQSKINEIRKLVQTLDQAQHRLSITVAQGRGLSLESLNANKTGGHVYQTQTDTQTQRLQTLDGQTAQIRFGEQFPTSSQAIIGFGATGQSTPQNPGGQVILSQSGQYKEISSGFAVTPRLSGNQVSIEIVPWSEQRVRGTIGDIRTNDAQTTLISNVGEWLEVGGQLNTSELSDNGQYAHNYSTRGNAIKIFIKVDDLDAAKP